MFAVSKVPHRHPHRLEVVRRLLESEPRSLQEHRHDCAESAILAVCCLLRSPDHRAMLKEFRGGLTARRYWQNQYRWAMHQLSRVRRSYGLEPPKRGHQPRTHACSHIYPMHPSHPEPLQVTGWFPGVLCMFAVRGPAPDHTKGGNEGKGNAGWPGMPGMPWVPGMPVADAGCEGTRLTAASTGARGARDACGRCGNRRGFAADGRAYWCMRLLGQMQCTFCLTRRDASGIGAIVTVVQVFRWV